MAEIDRRPNAFVNQFIIQPEEIILGAKLGEGAFGVVYAAEVRASHVACKVPKKNFLSKTQHEEFVREVEIMRYAALYLSLSLAVSLAVSSLSPVAAQHSLACAIATMILQQDLPHQRVLVPWRLHDQW